MRIVRLALNRPYTFVVLAILILLLSPAVILRTPTDIFPNIDIPVISAAWTYTGLNPEDLEIRLTTPFEKGLTTLVDNIERIESTTYNGTAVVKVYLQPGAQRRPRELAGGSTFRLHSAASSSGHAAARDHQLQRF
jgi:multidrug efflux pump subunit AcrB